MPTHDYDVMLIYDAMPIGDIMSTYDYNIMPIYQHNFETMQRTKKNGEIFKIFFRHRT